MTLNEKLTHLRKNEGLSQIEVSEKLAISRQAVSRWESGESRPSTDNLQALCKLYHVRLDYLLNESEDEPQATTPTSTAAESEPEPTEQKSGKRWIRLLIGVVSLAVVIACILLYVNRPEESEASLRELQGEDTVPSEGPEFNLNLE